MTKEGRGRPGRPPGTTKKSESKYLSEKQYAAFQEAIKRNPMTDFLFNLMLVTASRVGEIADLKLEDIKLD